MGLCEGQVHVHDQNVASGTRVHSDTDRVQREKDALISAREVAAGCEITRNHNTV